MLKAKNAEHHLHQIQFLSHFIQEKGAPCSSKVHWEVQLVPHLVRFPNSTQEGRGTWIYHTFVELFLPLPSRQESPAEKSGQDKSLTWLMGGQGLCYGDGSDTWGNRQQAVVWTKIKIQTKTNFKDMFSWCTQVYIRLKLNIVMYCFAQNQLRLAVQLYQRSEHSSWPLTMTMNTSMKKIMAKIMVMIMWWWIG